MTETEREKDIFMTNVTINKEQKLYVIPCGKGYTCLGFKVLQDRNNALALELDRKDLMLANDTIGTLAAYKNYSDLVELARERFNRTGVQLKSELTPQLVGLEGRRVEVIDVDNETKRFIVGKSTGFIPCHLEIHNVRSSGGMAASKEYKSVKIIR